MHACVFHRHWAERLYGDYDHICFMYRVRLRRPVIQVTKLDRYWGLWDPMTRTISISTDLIEAYPWDVVLEIFKHEIAHQITSELFRSDEAHGPNFRRACEMLGVSAWAARAEADMSHPIAPLAREAGDPADERLLKRVEKLLALATSGNEHEALLAMQRVQELYAKYNLDRIEQRRKDKLIYLTLKTGRKRIERYHYLVCSILNEHFFVQVIHGSLYDARELADFKIIELLGTQENVLMAEYVYHFLLNQVRMLWEDYRRAHKKRARAKSSFFLGVLSGFRDKLDRHREEAKARTDEALRAEGRAGAGNPFALVAAEDRELEDFVAYRYPRLVKVRGGTSLRDSGSFEAGREQGFRLVLHKGVASHDGNGGKLLR